MGAASKQQREFIEVEAEPSTVRVYLDDFDTGQLIAELERRGDAARLIPAVPKLAEFLRGQGFQVVEPDYPPSTAAGITDLAAFARWRRRNTPPPEPPAPPSGLWFWG